LDGYYDDHGRWAPVASGGYYDDRGQWVSSASGHYEGGLWVAGHAAGAYDANGRWVAGALSGHTDANGVWVADAQPGYYDSDHHWRSGQVRGYYDTRGVWIGATLAADAYGHDAGFQGDGEDRRDLDTREAWLERRIDSAVSDRAITRDAADQDRDQLAAIRGEETDMRERLGQLSPRDEARLQSRLDALSAEVRQSVNGAGF
jgi:hypothetical protein